MYGIRIKSTIGECKHMAYTKSVQYTDERSIQDILPIFQNCHNRNVLKMATFSHICCVISRLIFIPSQLGNWKESTVVKYLCFEYYIPKMGMWGYSQAPNYSLSCWSSTQWTRGSPPYPLGLWGGKLWLLSVCTHRTADQSTWSSWRHQMEFYLHVGPLGDSRVL